MSVAPRLPPGEPLRDGVAGVGVGVGVARGVLAAGVRGSSFTSWSMKRITAKTSLADGCSKENMIASAKPTSSRVLDE